MPQHLKKTFFTCCCVPHFERKQYCDHSTTEYCVKAANLIQSFLLLYLSLLLYYYYLYYLYINCTVLCTCILSAVCGRGRLLSHQYFITSITTRDHILNNYIFQASIFLSSSRNISKLHTHTIQDNTNTYYTIYRQIDINICT